jgi:peptidylprolyl isomerase
MKRLLLAAAMALSCHVAVAADTDPIVAERGSAVITASQARALINGTDPETRHKLVTDPATLQIFLRNVMLQQAILDEAKTQKWEQRPEVAALLQRAHDQVLAQSFLNAQAPLPAGYPTDSDIQAAYDQNKSRFMQPRTYHLVQIFIGAAAAGHPDDGRKRLLDLRTKLLRSRMTFEDAAKTVPGARFADLGFVPDTALVETVKPAIVGLPEGGVTEPICTPGGCTLLRLMKTRAAGPAPLDEVHDQIVRALREQKGKQEASAYASKLLEKQPIQLNEIQLAHLAQSP